MSFSKSKLSSLPHRILLLPKSEWFQAGWKASVRLFFFRNDLGGRGGARKIREKVITWCIFNSGFQFILEQVLDGPTFFLKRQSSPLSFPQFHHQYSFLLNTVFDFELPNILYNFHHDRNPLYQEFVYPPYDPQFCWKNLSVFWKPLPAEDVCMSSKLIHPEFWQFLSSLPLVPVYIHNAYGKIFILDGPSRRGPPKQPKRH